MAKYVVIYKDLVRKGLTKNLIKSHVEHIKELHYNKTLFLLRISASPFYPAYYANRLRHETTSYTYVKRLRGIWGKEYKVLS